MDATNTKQLIEQAKARYNHSQSRHALEAKYKSQLTVIYKGGMWDISVELLGLLSTLQNNQRNTFILCDSYNKPVEIDVSELYTTALEKYDHIMSAWLAEYTELSKLR